MPIHFQLGIIKWTLLFSNIIKWRVINLLSFLYFILTILEDELVKNRLLTTISRLSTEWIVSLTLRLTSLASESSLCNIIHLSIGGNTGRHGTRTPAFYLNPTKDELHFASSIDNSYSRFTRLTNSLALNVSTRIEVHQRYTNGGNYRYFIKINGEEVYIINTNAQQFYNVKVYASNPWSPSACPGYIKNFEVTNFL